MDLLCFAILEFQSLSFLRVTTVYMPTPCWLKHLCSIRALVTVSCFLSLSLSFRLIPWSAEVLCVYFPARASKTLLRRRFAPSPHREGAWGLRKQSMPSAGALLAFCVNQGISASFSLLYFLIGQFRTTRFRCIKGPQQSMVSQRVGHNWVCMCACTHTHVFISKSSESVKYKQ